MNTTGEDMSRNAVTRSGIERVAGNISTYTNDLLVTELPLQVVLAYGPATDRKRENLLVTMRTPGDDFNMLPGFLFCEGIINQAADIVTMKYIGNPGDAALQQQTILVELAAGVAFDTGSKRGFITSSACGFCGKTSADLYGEVFAPLNANFSVPASVITALPAKIKNTQSLFSLTGGAHAVALFDTGGNLLQITEDVGRHNAMDKMVGSMLQKNQLPLNKHIILFSGRLSYELVQKSLVAGAALICSIGAPSSLAIELARDYGAGVAGFVKENGFNIYCGNDRFVRG